MHTSLCISLYLCTPLYVHVCIPLYVVQFNNSCLLIQHSHVYVMSSVLSWTLLGEGIGTLTMFLFRVCACALMWSVWGGGVGY